MRDLPIEVLSFDHVALATWDATVPARLMTEVLGGRFIDGGDHPDVGYRWLQFALPGGTVEILEPLTCEGFLYRFLTRRGEGLHHVTLKVRDLAGSIGTLREAGFEPVGVDLSHEHWKEAFLHPRDTAGILIQLAETSADEPQEHPPATLDEFLRDRPGLRPD